MMKRRSMGTRSPVHYRPRVFLRCARCIIDVARAREIISYGGRRKGGNRPWLVWKMGLGRQALWKGMT